MTFKELREKLTPEDILHILKDYNVDLVSQTNSYIVFPTCCHNLSGGSPKLYYYKKNFMFKCFTQCGSVFDIFELIIKMEALRGRVIGKVEAIQRCGLKVSSTEKRDLANDSVMNDIAHLHELNSTEKEMVKEEESLELLDPSLLDDCFEFSPDGLRSWIKEGIDLNTMLKYNIMYDSVENMIIIPHYDEYGDLVGIIGRNMNEEYEAKYKPIVIRNKLCNFPKSKTLYGYYLNKSAIQLTKTCIMFEAEKSVMKMDAIYNSKNISVAVSGQTISDTQIDLLMKAQVRSVIIAFDADYKTEEERNEVQKKYEKIAKPLLNYFDVSLIIDKNSLLGYKDSPIDKGEKIFTQLMKDRVFL